MKMMLYVMRSFNRYILLFRCAITQRLSFVIVTFHDSMLQASFCKYFPSK